MSKKFQIVFGLLIVLSMLLGACAAPAPAPVVTEAPKPAATEAPAPVATQAPVVEPTAEPTAEPTPTEEPAPDFSALFTALIAGMPADKGFNSVKPATLAEEMASKPPFILDVREKAEVEKDGFIEGAVNIPVREVMKNLDKLPGLDDPIVVYCASGHRGGMVMAALNLMGYTNVRNLGGGLGAWVKASLPVVTGSMPAEPQAISKPIVENAVLYKALDDYFSNLPEGFYTVKADKLAEALASADAPVVVDVRTDAEVKKDGYIDGSVHIPFSDLMANLDKLPAQDKPVVLYCASGHRGGMAMMALRFLGYQNVTNLAGGLGGWKTAKMPVVGASVDWNALWTEFLTTLPEGYYTIKADALNTQLADKPPFLLDVREPAEVEKDGFIAGAVNIPVRETMKNLDKLPAQDQPIVVYCASGHRGAMVMAALRFLGYTNVLNLNGGLGAWKKAEFATETGKPADPVAGTAPTVDAQRQADLDAFISGLPEGFYTVKAADLNTELAEAAPALIDVRTAEEYAGGYIEGAVNVPINDLMANLSQYSDKAAKIVTLCQGGHRGALALMALRMTGYTDVRNLAGGMNAWVAAELPVKK